MNETDPNFLQALKEGDTVVINGETATYLEYVDDLYVFQALQCGRLIEASFDDYEGEFIDEDDGAPLQILAVSED